MEAEQYADEYSIHYLLGEGGQANVYLASKGSDLYALKVYLPGANKQAAFKIEADFLSKLNHPHLINMVDQRIEAKVKVNNRPEEKRAIIVLQLAQGGELFEFLSKTGRFSAQVCRAYFKQIITAIKYLVSVNVAHRDLKPENILFDKNFTLKVSDFGLARDAKGNMGNYKLTSRVGTEGYKPPEMEVGNYTGLAADLFAAGVVLFIMFNGTPPFLSTKANDRIYQLIKTKNFPKFWALHEKNKQPNHFPDSFKRLINSLLSAEVDRRPEIDDIEKDEWVTGDDIMINDLITYMTEKANKLAQNDPNRKKLAELRQKMSEKCMQDEECGGSRGEYDEEQTEGISIEDYCTRNFRRYRITTEELPVYEIKGLAYLKESPSFIVAWLQSQLREFFLSKETFMQGFVSEVTPKNFNISYKEESHILQAKLSFEIDNEDIQQLELAGHLHRTAKGQVSVEWRSLEGNTFWTNAIATKLNDSLRTAH